MAGTPVFNLAGTAVTSTTAATVAWPSHATNHVALLVVQTDGEAVTLSTANGFARVTNSPQTTGTAAATNAVTLDVFWCRATSAAMSSPVIADPGDHILANIVTFTNVATSGNPWDITAGGVKAAASTNCQITGATTTTNNCLAVAIVAGSTDSTTVQASAWTNANLANPATAEYDDQATNTGGGGSISVGGGGLATAGAIGTTTVTLATASKNAFMVVALKQDTAITGTGSMAVAVPSHSGSGIVGVLGIGAMAVALALAGTGQQTHSGTGSMAVPVPTMSGVGGQPITGTGSLAVAPSMSGTCIPNTFNNVRQSIINGLTSAQSEAHGWNAEVKAKIAVTDVVRTSDTVVTITLDAESLYDITAQETITVTVPSVALIAPAGPLVATPTFTVDVASSGTTGTGSLAIPPPAYAGTVVQTEFGSGSLAVAAPAFAGTTVQTESGSGTLALPPPVFSGTVVQTQSGTGSLSVAPSLSGSGTSGSSVTGSGSLIVGSPSYAVTAIQTELGSGSLAVATPGISGSGKQTQTGTGSITLAAPQLAGSGNNLQPITGAGNLVVALVLSAHGSNVRGSGAARGEYGPEHRSALNDLRDALAGGFRQEHGDALRDVGDVGV